MKPSGMKWHVRLHHGDVFHAMLTTLSFLTAYFYIYIPEDRVAVNGLTLCLSRKRRRRETRQLAVQGQDCLSSQNIAV